MLHSKSAYHLLFILPKSSFGRGRGKVYGMYPNEDLGRNGRPNEHSGTYFRGASQRNVAQIDYYTKIRPRINHGPSVRSTSQNIRLGESINATHPKRRLGQAEPAFPNAFPREALFNGESTLFWLQNARKCFEKRIRKGCRVCRACDSC